MKLEYDPVKEQLNLSKHGISLARFADLDWDKASITQDNRKSYGETRYIAAAELKDRLHISCFTLRGNTFRVISLRKANQREERTYHDSKEER